MGNLAEQLLHCIMKLEVKKFKVARQKVPFNPRDTRVCLDEVKRECQEFFDDAALAELLEKKLLLEHSVCDETCSRCFNSYAFLFALKFGDLRKWTGIKHQDRFSRPRTLGFDIKYCETLLPQFNVPLNSSRICKEEGTLWKDACRVAVSLYSTYSQEQLEAMEYILSSLSGSKNVTVIDLPTGSGKTEAFLIPAISNALSNGLSIIVYPRKALATDQLKRIIEVFAVLKIAGFKDDELCRAYTLLYDGDSKWMTRRNVPRDKRWVPGDIFSRTGEFISYRLASILARHGLLSKSEEKMGVRVEPKNTKVFCWGFDVPALQVYIYRRDGSKLLEQPITIPVSDVRMEEFKWKPGIIVTNYDMYNRLLSSTQQGLMPFEEILKMYDRFLLVFDEAHEFRGVDFIHLLMLILRTYARAVEAGRLVSLTISSATLPADFENIVKYSLQELLGQKLDVKTVEIKGHSGVRRVTFVAFVLPDADTSGQWLDQLGLFYATMALETRMNITRDSWRVINFVDSVRYLKDIRSNALRTLFAEKENVVDDHLSGDGSLMDWSDILTLNGRLPVQQVVDVIAKVPDTWDEKRGIGYLAVHYAALDVKYRNELEEALRKARYPRAVIATSTLEMGIDIPRIFAILQFRRPPSPESFVQRIGRAGRGRETAHTAVAAVFLTNMPSDALLMLDEETNRKYLYACFDENGKQYSGKPRTRMAINESVIAQHLVLETVSQDPNLARTLGRNRVDNLSDLESFISRFHYILVKDKRLAKRLERILQGLKTAYSASGLDKSLRTYIIEKLDKLISEIINAIASFEKSEVTTLQEEIKTILGKLTSKDLQNTLDVLNEIANEIRKFRRAFYTAT